MEGSLGDWRALDRRALARRKNGSRFDSRIPSPFKIKDQWPVPLISLILFWLRKKRTGTWLSEQMGHSISTVSRWMTNKVQPSVEQLYEIARHLDVDVKELLVSSKVSLCFLSHFWKFTFHKYVILVIVDKYITKDFWGLLGSLAKTCVEKLV